MGMVGIAYYESGHPLTQNQPDTSSGPTASQLFSILSSNPNLQDLELFRGFVPDCDVSTFRVSLPSLKQIHLKGRFRNTFGLIKLLDLPDKMDEVLFFLDDCSRSDLLQTVGPYVGALVQRRGRFQEGLGLRVNPREARFHIFAGDVTEVHGSTFNPGGSVCGCGSGDNGRIA